MIQVGKAQGFGFVKYASVVAMFLLCSCGGDSGGSGGSCSISGCGGDIKGTWDVTAMCSNVSAAATPMTGIAACDAGLKAAIAGAKTIPMDLQLTFTDTTYSIAGNFQVAFHYTFTKECLAAQSVTASASTCSQIASSMSGSGINGTCAASGGACACDVTEAQPLNANEPYTVSGTMLTLGSSSGPYCVTGDTAQFSGGANGFSGALTLKRH
jgi:hypothetical protein